MIKIKNTFCILLLLLSSITIQAQKEKKIKIYATENKTFNMFFPFPIERAVVGAGHFKFGYNKNVEDFVGVLKASKGPESNLTVITTDGRIYSFSLLYSKDITITDFFVKPNFSIGNINNNLIERNKKQKDSIKNINLNTKIKLEEISYKEKEKVFLKNAKMIMGSKPYYVRNFKYNSKVKFQIKNVFYIDDKFYLLMSIDNSSNINYDINFIEFYIASKSSTKNKSGQKILVDPLYNYNYKKVIEKKSQNEFVIVFPKISINNKKLFIAEINERKGEKNIAVSLDYITLNNPQKL